MLFGQLLHRLELVLQRLGELRAALEAPFRRLGEQFANDVLDARGQGGVDLRDRLGILLGDLVQQRRHGIAVERPLPSA